MEGLQGGRTEGMGGISNYGRGPSLDEGYRRSDGIMWRGLFPVTKIESSRIEKDLSEIGYDFVVGTYFDPEKIESGDRFYQNPLLRLFAGKLPKGEESTIIVVEPSKPEDQSSGPYHASLYRKSR